MKRLISIILCLLIMIGCFAGCKQKAEPSPQQDSSQQNPDPSASDPTSAEEPSEPPTTNITLTQAKQIAEDLIAKYHRFSFLGVCCDVEYIDSDMSGFLTQTQKNHYSRNQYKITCCHSMADIQQHTLKHLDQSLIPEINSENFFWDDQGNMYVLFQPFGFEGGRNVIEVLNYSNAEIIATETAYDELDIAMSCDTYTIVMSDNGFVIKNIERENFLF